MVQQPYYELLAEIHRHLRPRTYVEIGVARGGSLARALRETDAIGIDPRELPFTQPVRCSMRRFKMMSDDFFARYDLHDLLGAVDLAFIDGMHLFEFALRDFVNLERHAHADSVVLIHDVKPLDEVTGARERVKDWSGDVWKIILILREHRPELNVTVVDVAPSGLALVSGLDPGSTVLGEAYDSICERFTPLQYDAGAERRLDAIPNEWELVRSLLPARSGVGSHQSDA